MKKGKITRLLLEIICGCLVLIVFSPFPAFAEDCDYTIYRADPGPLLVLDGRAGDSEPWAHVPWSTGFSQTGSAGVDGDHPAQAGFGAQFKSLWQKDGDAAYLWFLVEVTDATVGYKANSWLADYFGIAIDENGDGTNELDTAAIYIPKRDGYDPPRLEYKVDDRRAAGNGYTIEMKYTFSNAANCEGTIKFDLLLNDNIMSSDSDSNRYVRYSWKGIRQTNPATPAVSGTGLLSQVFAGSLVPDPPSAPDVILMKGATVVGTLQKGADGTVKLPDCETSDLFVGWVNEAGALYAVGAHYPVGESSEKLSAVIVAFGMMPGAAVKVENPTSIRFAMEFSAGWEAVAPFVKEKEIVIAEANLLTDAILADHAFTVQELSAAGIAADVCPVTAERTETGYRLSGEKEAVENAETVYAACGSFTVAFADGSTHTHTAVYDPAKNARSVRVVAQKAYAERSNIRLTSTDGIAYLYKVSIRYAVGDFLSYSFSPYTADQLEILLTLIGKKPE